MINVFEILRKQPKVQNTEFTKIVFIHSVTTYLLNKTKTNFVALLAPLGSLLNTFHIQVPINDLKALKRTYTTNDVLIQLAEIIINSSGYNDNLLVLLKTLITYENNIK